MKDRLEIFFVLSLIQFYISLGKFVLVKFERESVTREMQNKEKELLNLQKNANSIFDKVDELKQNLKKILKK